MASRERFIVWRTCLIAEREARGNEQPIADSETFGGGDIGVVLANPEGAGDVIVHQQDLAERKRDAHVVDLDEVFDEGTAEYDCWFLIQRDLVVEN